MGRMSMSGLYGWRVVGAAFLLAVFGWGLGFYGVLYGMFGSYRVPLMMTAICDILAAGVIISGRREKA